MRILNIRFRNLNSLAGDWCIDLTAPEYSANGIFAITGPTGAGKSTILDAVCLALYGSTPRLGKVSKGGNDIMTRHTGECFAEVTFSTVHGEFRCVWSQRRAHKKAEGELQPPRHEIFDAGGLSLAGKIHDVGRKVEELTGMDFERFTQSTLLAQGKFAAFLLAEGSDRAPLLEQMTGTGIYSEISEHIFRRNKAEQEKLAALDASLEQYDIFSAEEELAIRAELEQKNSKADQLSAKETALNKTLETLRTAAALEKEEQSLVQEQEALQNESLLFGKDRLRLEKARRALLFSGDCSALLARQNEQVLDEKTARILADDLGPLTERAAEKDALCDMAEKAVQTERLACAALTETLKTVRALDIQIRSRNDDLTARQNVVRESRKKLELSLVRIQDTEQALAKDHLQLSECSQWLESRRTDEDLPQVIAAQRTAFSLMEQQEKRLLTRAQTIAETASQRESKKKLAESLHASFSILSEERRTLETRLTEADTAIASLLQGQTLPFWRKKKEEKQSVADRLNSALASSSAKAALLGQIVRLEQSALLIDEACTQEKASLAAIEERIADLEKYRENLEETIALLDRIRSYEEERKHLSEGSPCPLCGATHHPYAENSTPEPDEKKSLLKECTQKLRSLTDELGQKRSEIAGLESDLAHTRTDIREKTLEADKLQQELDEQLKELSSALPLSVSPCQYGEQACTLLDGLENAKRQVLAELSAIALVVAQAEEQETALARMRTELDTIRGKTEKAQAEKLRAEQEYGILLVREQNLSAEQESEQALLDESFRSFQLLLTAYGIAALSVSDIPDALRQLEERSSLFLLHKQKEERLVRSCNELEKALIVDRQSSEQTEALCLSIENELQNLSTELEKLVEYRKHLFGETDPDCEERAAFLRLDQLEKSKDELRKAREEAVHLRDETTARLADLKRRIEERAVQIAAFEKELSGRLISEGFQDIRTCLDACLEEKESAELEAAERLLEQKEASIKAKKQECRRRREELGAVPEESSELLQEQLAETKELITSLREDIGAKREKLENNERKKKSAAETEEKRSVQKDICRRWADLNELIGSADGKKFRNYAQGLTFRLLISHANRQLSAMTDRYCLVQTPGEPLSLSVIDRYQADTVRTSRNLSGGESFLVSLSLALGLARMASRTVRVDSVFLDEGFGTLDEESLNMALDMLSNLREQGKTIGIISHMQTIRDRIGVRIQVEPEGNGRSRLYGPGISRGSAS